jgi:hypothetical protein
MTLKAYKAAITVGTRMRVIDHWMPRHKGAIRTVQKVQGNGFYFTEPDAPHRFWSPFPKAAELEFDGRIAKIALQDEKPSWATSDWKPAAPMFWSLEILAEGSA